MASALRVPPVGRLLVLGLISAIALAIAFSPPIAGATPKAMLALGIVAFTVGLWATSAVPHPVAAVAFFVLAFLSMAASWLSLVQGFVSSGAGLAFGGLLIGTAADRSGLGRWVARGFVSRFGGSYSRLTLGVLIGNLALGFLIPASLGRMAITIPLVAAAAKEAGYDEGSRPYVGLMLTVVVGGFVTSFGVLPANLMNILVTSAATGSLGITFSYGAYLLACFPVLALAKAMLYWALSVAVFRPRGEVVSASLKPATAERLSSAGRRLAVVLAITISLWATDFLHGIAPGWVALAAGAATAMPGLRLVSPKEMVDKPKVIAMLGLGAVLGLAALLTESGAGKVIAELLTRSLDLRGMPSSAAFLAIALMSSLLAAVTTMVGALSIITPSLHALSRPPGMSLEAAVYAELAGFNCLLFPYQAVPILVGLAISGVRYSEALRITIPVALVSMAVILPLNAAWLRIIGLLS
ncbi:MAG: hypothetical protein F9K44_12980 [Hyphomicrobiaceae bacterium]|nr:MAG: hypothetical protein F9K44_12980 [Hyphomicrobiaceae bacterium]